MMNYKQTIEPAGEWAAHLNPNEMHIDTLRRHGGKIIGPDGMVEVNSYFYYNAIDNCFLIGCEALIYDLYLPGIDTELALAIHRDGHVDSGSREMVAMVLDR